MKKIYFSRHAKNRMRKFAIKPDVVRKVLEKPDFLEPSIKGRKNFWRKVQDKYYRVTCLEEGDKIVVITVTPKEKIPGRVRDED
ncbi:hypothetical protein DRI96_04270 [Candidatus Aerophobetes bacterium]|uniref:DUF4258 domain-containing protein n=1 Tax=Aerophobetes bacterium TaxID=2030807 RepID=A0A662DE54_UNCAE|nr:MAG: hypothetical protein DRI96_04270 [Candidatus Aerophobetes bacterium]